MLIVTKDEKVIPFRHITKFQIRVELDEEMDDDKYYLEARFKNFQEYPLGEYSNLIDARWEFEKIQAAEKRGDRVYLLDYVLLDEN